MTSSGRRRGLPKRGWTLLEVLVAASLGLLMLGLVSQFLVPTLRAYVRGTARVDMQRAAVMALQQISADLSNASVGSVSIRSSDPVTIGIVRLKNVSAQGQQVWDDRMIFYSLRGTRLIRKEWPPPPPTLGITLDGSAPARLTAQELANVSDQLNGTESLVALDVTKFEITSRAGTGAVADPLTLTVRLERTETQRKKPEVFELTRVVSMKQRL